VQYLQIVLEQDYLMKSLKTSATSFVDDPNKVSVGGYGMQNMNTEIARTYISELTGLIWWSGSVTSIDFTRDEKGVWFPSVKLSDCGVNFGCFTI
jgi:hypothetical protein